MALFTCSCEAGHFRWHQQFAWWDQKLPNCVRGHFLSEGVVSTYQFSTPKSNLYRTSTMAGLRTSECGHPNMKR